MGIFANGGGLDPISGTYDYDADYGDTVDRVSFSAIIPGTQLRAMIASDWGATRLVSNQTTANRGREGHPWDLDDGDDSNAWTLVFSRMDSPTEFKEKTDRGDTAANYGIYFEYKKQEFDLDLSGFTQGGTFDSAANYKARKYKTYSPSIWGKLGIGQVTLEGELVASLGKVDRLDEFNFTAPADIRKYGGAGRFTFRGLDNKLRMGVETGFATGDQHDNIIPGNIHVSFANQLGDPSDHKLTQFMFNREYKVDMILWRHLIRPHQVDRVQGLQHHLVRDESRRDAGQQHVLRHRVQLGDLLQERRVLHRLRLWRAVPVRRAQPPRTRRFGQLVRLHRGRRARRQHPGCRDVAHDPVAHGPVVLIAF
jgi:uncharacterized protein (TIGR04551 family)